jgi:hypothetical protein
MSNHFNLKSLAFYGGAIAFVVVLFSLTTSYGEAHLKAPRDVNGYYPIDTNDLPGCLGSKRLTLDIKQSGVYVTGALLEADASEKATKAIEQHPPLTGQWNNHQLSLTGSLTHLKECNGTVTINGEISEDNKLNGTISLNSAESKSFTAQREKPKPAAQGH